MLLNVLYNKFPAPKFYPTNIELINNFAA